MVYNKTEKVMEKHQTIRKKIVRAAKEILIEEEIGTLSIKSVAKRAGIATGTFYLYFTNKEGLLSTVMQEIYEELLAYIKHERAKHQNIFDKLKASMEICIRIFMKERQLARILLEYYPEYSSGYQKKIQPFERSLIQFVKEDLDELLALGQIPLQDTLVSAIAFVGSFRQVILHWVSNGEPENRQQAFETLLNYNLRGLGRNSM